jgi:NAD(P)-dependent dehydrogenase (short-subunit alcohol dehydrogenase family)
VHRFTDRIAVVSGAARSFGSAVTAALAAEGARVAAVDLRDREAPPGGVAITADVSDPHQVAVLHDRVAAELGPADILVNLAGVNASTPFEHLDLSEWRHVLTINLDSQFLMCAAFAPDMTARGWGRIVNMASSSIRTNTPGLTAYMASKAGVLGLTSGLANDLGPYGVTVNAVSPGLTRTEAVDADIVAGRFPEAAYDTMPLTRAIPRHASVDDLVGTILFLCSDAAAFMTGQFLVADGGATRGF